MASTEQQNTNRIPLMVIAWAWVTVPFIYGIYELVQKVTQLFNG
ncbi:hypothetical protein GCM10027176_64310 [Actinoallomurus bryophytorum]|uniref:Uncharacterized protein n=1 Tax=Actinoallomurus bryophytorum TaxID=1490222 RepID=A0A543CVB6_9ACTN|nr:hypothetical protein [Actinoallomurus bryophytorum]TQM01045.1 hypothetical protein FB559_6788 [Actinoallomurus bryophytorum]